MRTSAIACLAALAACASVFHPRPTVEDDIAAYERERPDPAQIAAGDLRGFDHMRNWRTDIDLRIDHDYLEGPATTELHQRVLRAQRAYAAEVVHLLTPLDPKRALEVSVELIDTDDVRLRESIAAAADALSAQRQQARAKAGTYRDADFKLAGQSNCVMARAPFGGDGKENRALSLRFSTADHQVHVRCYLPDVGFADTGTRVAFISKELGGWLVVWSGPFNRKAKYIDFTIDPSRLVLDRDKLLAKAQTAELVLLYTNGKRLAFEDDGRVAIVPNVKGQVLATTSFVWERDATVVAGK